MKVQEIMERVGARDTGRAIAYIKDALEEMGLKTHSHIDIEKQDIKNGKRYYDIPFNALMVLNIRCKNQNNSENKYEIIPRTIYEPSRGDDDGI
jgi:hypothetical protein